MIAFGRFAQAAQYSTIAGQPGARRRPAEHARELDGHAGHRGEQEHGHRHRTVGRPGVVLVGEGSPSRLPSLLAAEKKRVSGLPSTCRSMTCRSATKRARCDQEAPAAHHETAAQPQGPAVLDLNYRLKALRSPCRCPRARCHGRAGCPSTAAEVPLSTADAAGRTDHRRQPPPPARHRAGGAIESPWVRAGPRGGRPARAGKPAGFLELVMIDGYHVAGCRARNPAIRPAGKGHACDP